MVISNVQQGLCLESPKDAHVNFKGGVLLAAMRRGMVERCGGKGGREALGPGFFHIVIPSKAT